MIVLWMIYIGIGAYLAAHIECRYKTNGSMLMPVIHYGLLFISVFTWPYLLYNAHQTVKRKRELRNGK